VSHIYKQYSFGYLDIFTPKPLLPKEVICIHNHHALSAWHVYHKLHLNAYIDTLYKIQKY